ncbi:MAG: 30S ribosomal protein S8, partial [Actinobacteria bacterium]|nr:30S ribosomal protein S8 [Actinomycetota bacterium]
TDPVADMLTRIRNANTALKPELYVPVSKMNDSLLSLLKREGFIASYIREGEGVHQGFKVELKYGKDRERTITNLKRISKPGRRVYANRNELPRVLGGLGIAIISTSQGVMTDREASRKGIGGEILAFVW